MKINSTGICILIAGFALSLSIIAAANKITKTSSWQLRNIDQTLTHINESIPTNPNLNRELYEKLMNDCIKESTVGFGEYDSARKRFCMNEILKTNIR
ncbi:hypothetical protein [Photobacterium leiognathi]|uniref:hypothetical protein n=1 Tax=Photobacterium leiognathi TaxID=553611 RepID=UPI002980E46D|nr:hypothetical protein [Photobacterium leiognathi]